MKLRSLNVHRVPGIYQPFSLEALGDGLHIVTGPNGSGKTTICRSFSDLLWPEVNTTEEVNLSAKIEIDGQIYHLERNGRSVTWTRDGADIARPDLPEGHVSRCFVLGVRDLLVEQDTDSKIVQQIQTQMTGGFDLQSVFENEFQMRTLPGKNREEKQLREKRRRITELKSGYERLADQETQLQQINHELTEAKTHASEAINLGKAKDFASTRDRLAGVKDQLDSFPSDLNLLQGNEKDELDELESAINEKDRQIKEGEGEGAEAEGEVGDCALPNGPISDAILSEHVNLCRELGNREQELRQAKQALEEKRSDAAENLRALGESIDSEKFRATDDAILKSAEDFLARADSLRLKRNELEAAIGLLDDGPEMSPEDQYRAAHALRKWLAAVSTKERRWLLLSSCVVCVIGIISAFFHFPTGLALVSIGVGVGVTWYLMRPTDIRAAARQEFEEVGLLPPKHWLDDDVRARQEELDKAYIAGLEARRNKDRKKDLEGRRRQLAEQESALSKDREKLSNATGLQNTADLTLSTLCQRIIAWQEADIVACGSEQSHKAIGQERDRLLKRLNEFLREHGEDEREDNAAIGPRIEHLSRRSAKHRSATDRARRAAADRETLLRELEDYKTKASDIWKRINLTPGESSELITRLNQLPRYRDLVELNKRLSINLEECSRALAECADLQKLTVSRIDELLGGVRKASQKVETLQKQKISIERDVSDARRQDELERAKAESVDLQGLLSERRDEAFWKTAGAFLIKKVRDEYESTEKPPVLKEADTLFSSFTRGRYALRVTSHETGQKFRAYDTEQEVLLELQQLSDATRIQLLLAARLAYALNIEKGFQIPLFLDEVLTTTDPVRFRAVAQSIASFVRDKGRQVFYFSAEPGDAEKWNRILQRDGFGAATALDLGDIRRLESAIRDPEELRVPSAAEVPSPDGMSAEDYGVKIGVPSIDPRNGAGSLHIFYLLRNDLPTLRQLLSMGIERVGACMHLMRNGGLDGVIDEAQRTRLSALSDLVEAYINGWAIGRGKPVDRGVLDAAGVGNTFLGRLTELTEELGNDSRRFMETIRSGSDDRTKRMRSRTQESLEQHLAENGYLDERPVLTEDQMVGHVLPRMTKHTQAGILTPEECAQAVRELCSLVASGMAAQSGDGE